MLLQRFVVTLYVLWTRVQHIKHKKWILLVLFSFYMGLWFSQKSPVVENSNDIFINEQSTNFKEKVDSMAPTRLLAPWTNDSFECVGWKRLYSCEDKMHKDDEVSTPEPEKEIYGCSEEIGPLMAGYCIVRNRTSGDLYKLMVSGCYSLPAGHFTCNMARDFSEFGYHSIDYEHAPVAPALALPYVASAKRKRTNGIAMIVYERVLPSAYATIRMLRLRGCTLPVELWYRPDEMSIDNPIMQKLLSDFNVRVRPIFDLRAVGFHVKPYAVYYSNFDNVLLLDTDNLPAKDPTYLFEEPEFLRTGALFWPDYWQPSNSLFQLSNTSFLWQLTGIRFVDMFEQESGQVLIDRLRSKRALDKLMYYSTHQPRLLEQLNLIWGDKDLFRLAWLNTSQPFHFIKYPPAVGGQDSRKEKGVFCGLAMIQHDVQGNLVFFHRNSVKLDGTLDQPRIMSHIQEYSLEGNSRDYRIFQAVDADKKCCYFIGTATLPDGRPAAQITPIGETIYAPIEELAIQLSVEARQLLLSDAIANDRGFRNMRVQSIVALLLLLYVVIIITFVWCKGRPARERLPSRFKSMEFKEI